MRMIRRPLAVFAALAGSTLLPVWASASTHPAAEVPFCSLATGLKATMRPGGVAAGTSYSRVVFVNAGGSDCVLSGIPGVQPVMGPAHLAVGPSSIHLPYQGRGGTVTLLPHHAADTDFGVETAANYPRARCEPEDAEGIMIHFLGVRAFYLKGAWSSPVQVCTLLQSTSTDAVAKGTSGP